MRNTVAITAVAADVSVGCDHSLTFLSWKKCYNDKSTGSFKLVKSNQQLNGLHFCLFCRFFSSSHQKFLIKLKLNQAFILVLDDAAHPKKRASRKYWSTSVVIRILVVRMRTPFDIIHTYLSCGCRMNTLCIVYIVMPIQMTHSFILNQIKFTSCHFRFLSFTKPPKSTCLKNVLSIGIENAL